MIEWYSNCGSEAEWYNEPQEGNKGSSSAVPFYEPHIDLETDEEQVECDADVAGEDERRKRLRWEDGLGETGNATHDCQKRYVKDWTENIEETNLLGQE